jgi:microcystin degradation protein MlrC
MARAIEESDPNILTVNVLAGFAFADVRDAGVSLTAVTVGDPAEARTHLRRLSQWACLHRHDGNVIDRPLDEVMTVLPEPAGGPVLLVEPSDNVGAGASGRGIAILRALIAHHVSNAAVVINAPEAVAALASTAPGECARITLGSSYDKPLDLDVELVSTSDGRFTLEDPQSHLASIYGCNIEMGPCATVRCGAVSVLLTSRKTPPFDLGQLRSQGIIPEELSVIGVKAAVAHRRAYDPIASASFSVDTPGPCTSNLRLLPYRNVRRPIFPLDEQTPER